VILDLVVGVMDVLFRPLLEAIPDVALGLPEAGALVGDFLRKLDSLIPILGPLRLMAALLGLLAVFLLIRGVLLARYIFLP
jgi:hypothetical protein